MMTIKNDYMDSLIDYLDKCHKHRDIPLTPITTFDEFIDTTVFTVYDNGKRKYLIFDLKEDGIFTLKYDKNGDLIWNY